MKIQTLHIKNIASIEEANIEFDKGMLAVEPIFLICGETGSGKTTILNAICLALYKRVPYFDTVGDDEKGRPEGRRKDADGWLEMAIQLDQIKNPEQLLRRGARQGEASLSFVGNDGHQYTATWEAHPNQRDKSKIKSSHKLHDSTAKITYTAVNEIKRIVEQAVGLNFDQFCRTTMLAQGQFAKFMCAKDDEKEAILEKLTATERFSIYGAAVHDKYIGIKRQYDILAEVIDQTRLLSDEEKDVIIRDMARLQDQIKANASLRKKIQEKIDWMARQQQLDSSLNAQLQMREELRERSRSQDFTDMALLVRDWDATVKVRADMRQRDTAMRQYAEDSLKINALRLETGRLLGAVDALKSEEKRLQTQSDACVQALDTFEPHKEMIENNAALSRELDRLINLLNTAKELRRKSAALQSALDDARALHSRLDADCRLAQDATDKCKAEAEMTAQEAANIDLTEFDNRIKAIDELKDLLINAKNTRLKFEENDEKEKSVKDKISSINRDITDETELLRDIESKMPGLESEENRLQGEYQGKLDLKNALTAIRQRFAETNECPLCGASVEHLHTDDVLEHSLELSLDKLRKAGTEVTAARSAKAQIEGSIKAMRKNLVSLHKDLDKYSAARIQAQQSLEAEFANCPKTIAEIDVQNAAADTKRKAIAAERKAATAKINANNDALKQLGEANKILIAAQKRLQKATDKVNKCQTEIVGNKDSIDKAEKDITDVKQYILDNTSCQMPSLDTDVDCSNAKDAIKHIVDAKKLAEDRKKDTQEKLLSVQARISACMDTTKRLTEIFPDAEAVSAVSITDVDKQLAKTLHQAASLQGSMLVTKDNIDDARARIDAYLDCPQSVDAKRLEEISKTSEDAYNKSRNALQQLYDAENRAKGAIAQLEKDIADHKTKCPNLSEEDSIDSLTLCKDQLEKTHSLDLEQLAQCRQKLRDDNDKRMRMQEQLAQKQRLEALRAKWLTLDRLYGGEKGANFRRIAQIHVLANLLQRANYFMRDLDDRYMLTSSGMSLNIYVSDRHIDAAPRAVNSLSGGEGFLASLALALALSTISKERIDVDILFIDEGFGTLSPGPLEKAMRTLRKLSSSGNRRIGIISHVEALRTIVPVKIQLERTSQSTSRILITDH